ncbi:MAG: hypothetical protein JSS40_15830 [Proteobacteria bacterium]|nr:hypothetical protein [Pseudomonadota bacterium]
MLERDDETVRWPTHLAHRDIVLRLVQFRGAALSHELPDIAERFAGVGAMSAMQIASRVLATIAWLEDKPGYRDLTRDLEMIAMNLKNLKNPDPHGPD